MNGTLDAEKETDVKSLVQDGFKMLNELVKMSNSFPTLNIRENVFKKNPSLMSEIELRSCNLNDLISNMLRKSDMGDIKHLNIKDQLEVLVEANDKFLDKSKFKVDEMNGISCIPPNVIAPILNTSKENNIVQDFELMQQSKDPKPQDSFKVPVDNSNTPFVPNILEKPNAVQPLSIPLKYHKNRSPRYCNPYEYEISHFEITEEQLRMREPINPRNLSSTPLIMVNDVKTLHDMITELSTINEIAVDLEHHSYRSFLGFTCLMQLSTREKDYIIDTISLRDELIALQAIFTNPAVVKVMHGAESDIMWLQKDFLLYVVNLFDTHQAAMLLGEPNLNLGSLLQEYCGVQSNKSYQLHDWRRRPLSDGAIEYARSDTHYLLYIYDVLRNTILNRAGTGSLINVYNRSGNICVKQYEKELIYPDSYLNLYKKYRKNLNSQQLSAVKKLYDWRDAVAREEDESTGYVLSNKCLMKLAERLPLEVSEILKCFHNLPPLIRKHVSTIQRLLQEASNEPLVEKVVECRSRLERPKRNDVEILLSKLSCPLDYMDNDDVSIDNTIDILKPDNIKHDKQPSLFDRFVTSVQVPSKLSEAETIRNEICRAVTTPYEIYKRTVEHNANVRKKRVLKRKMVTKKVTEQEKVESELVMEIKRDTIPSRLTSGKVLPLILPVAIPEANITKNTKRTVKQQMRGHKKWKGNNEVKEKEKEDRIIDEIPMITGDANEGDNKKEVEQRKKLEGKKKKPRSNVEETNVKKSKPATPFDYKKVNFSKFMTGPDNTLMKKLQKANAGLFGKKGKIGKSKKRR